MRQLLFVGLMILGASTAEAQKPLEAELGTNESITDVNDSASATPIEKVCNGDTRIFTNLHTSVVYVAWGTSGSVAASSSDLPVLPDRQSVMRVPRGYNFYTARAGEGSGGILQVMCGSGM